MQLLKTRAPALIPVRSSYGGKKGFYCCMYPTSATLLALQQHLEKIPQLKDKLVPPPLQHVTIMYSNTAIPMEELPWINRDVVLGAQAVGYDLFIKPHAEDGAVVMLLSSPDLEAYHEELAKLAEYTWDEYKPHLTLAYGVSPTEAAIIISALAALPLPQGLTFTAPVFEDKS